jgi:dolichol-phosphate mannosyltransferase
MDCDLQDRPEEIPNLYRKAQEGFDSVFAQRIVRMDSFSKRLLSKLFYKLFCYLTDTIQDPTVANFGIYNRCVVDAILSMQDQIKFFPTMVQWVGFKKSYLQVAHSARMEGNSTYNFSKLLHLALDTVIAFSDKPMRLAVKLGFTITFISVIVSFIYFILHLIGLIQVVGFTSLILSVWFLSGTIMLILGVLGLYIGKMFEKVKGRPVFIVKEAMNFDNK